MLDGEVRVVPLESAGHLPPSHFSSFMLPPTLVMRSSLCTSRFDTCTHWSARSWSHWEAWISGPALPLAVSSARTAAPAPPALGGYCAQMRFFDFAPLSPY